MFSKSERTEQFSKFSDWLLQNAVRAPVMTQDEPQSATPVPFDGQMLQEVFGLDRQELHAMLDIVVRDLGRYLIELEAAVAAGDFDGVGRSAHRLRGPSSAVLAWETCDAASAVEAAAQQGDSHLVQAAVANLHRLHEELVKALEAFDRGSAS